MLAIIFCNVSDAGIAARDRIQTEPLVQMNCGLIAGASGAGIGKRDIKRVDRSGPKLAVGDKIRVSGIPPDVGRDIYEEEEFQNRV